MKRILFLAFAVLATASFVASAAPPEGHGMMARPASTPKEMVDTYNSLADGILALKRTEWNLVHSILALTYGHAEAAFGEAQAKMAAGKDCSKDIEALADYVSQLGNEGDSAVAGVRKRLLEGGHHHHAMGEQQGEYEEGFVIVTRKAKKIFLDAAGEIGRMASSPNKAALEGAMKKVSGEYHSLMMEAKP